MRNLFTAIWQRLPWMHKPEQSPLPELVVQSQLFSELIEVYPLESRMFLEACFQQRAVAR